MDLHKLAFFVFPVIYAYLVLEYRKELWMLLKTRVILSRPDVKLVVGILSARDHFLERESIRNTWLGYVTRNATLNEKAHIKFIIGSKPCEVPVEDRIDEYSCEYWKVEYPQNNITEQNIVEDLTLPSDFEPARHATNYPVQKIFFKVLHPLILTHLGIHQSSIGTYARVRFKDSASDKTIVEADFTEKNPGELIHGLYYKPVQAYMLPKGFEGYVEGENMASGSNQLSVAQTLLNVPYNSADGLIQFSHMPQIPDDHYEDPRVWTFNHIPVVSFRFKIHELEALEMHIALREPRHDAYTHKLQAEENRLAYEDATHGDLVFVDVVDTYRNVPHKLIKFHQWAKEEVLFKFLLKTDDDCYVDVEKVLAKLEAASQGSPLNHDSLTWWGRFRHNWAVDRVGKWAEGDYMAPVYPSFACGAGNVVSSAVVSWLTSNAHALHALQGEDTSMGVWLAAVRPRMYDDPLWVCEQGECLSDMYVMPDVHYTHMVRYWNDRVTCGDPCGCT